MRRALSFLAAADCERAYVRISNGNGRLRPLSPPAYSRCHLPLAFLTCLFLIASACATPWPAAGSFSI
jgi:hypothetical protein